MTAEQTKEQKLRAATRPCWVCGARLTIGANYPPSAPLPRSFELWCAECEVINLYQLVNQN